MVVTWGWRDALGMWWAEASHAAKHPMGHRTRTAPSTKMASPKMSIVATSRILDLRVWYQGILKVLSSLAVSETLSTSSHSHPRDLPFLISSAESGDKYPIKCVISNRLIIVTLNEKIVFALKKR